MRLFLLNKTAFFFIAAISQLDNIKNICYNVFRSSKKGFFSKTDWSGHQKVFAELIKNEKNFYGRKIC